jgi:hypothetical protein
MNNIHINNNNNQHYSNSHNHNNNNKRHIYIVSIGLFILLILGLILWNDNTAVELIDTPQLQSSNNDNNQIIIQLQHDIQHLSSQQKSDQQNHDEIINRLDNSITSLQGKISILQERVDKIDSSTTTIQQSNTKKSPTKKSEPSTPQQSKPTLLSNWNLWNPKFDSPITIIPNNQLIPCENNNNISPLNTIICNKNNINSSKIFTNQVLDNRGVMFMLIRSPSQPIIESESFLRFAVVLHEIDLFYPYPIDVMILHENIPISTQILYASVTKRKILWVDVSSHFRPELPPGIDYKGCTDDTRIGYRYMCQFMSGPVYWLKAFDPYKYAFRFDLDSDLTKLVSYNLFDIMEQRKASYAFVLDEFDWDFCQVGFIDFVKNWTLENPTSTLSKPTNSNTSIPLPTYLFREGTWETYSVRIFNCNFEVVNLNFFRSKKYRAYHKALENSLLFFTTRLGDHAVKTFYLTMFENPKKIVCLHSLPYQHAGGSSTVTCNTGEFGHVVV